MNRAIVVAVAAAGIVAGLVAAHQFRRGEGTELERATLYEAPRPLPEVVLVDHGGSPFGPERLRGRWTFVFFGFVNCPDICPTTLATLAAVRASLADLPPTQRPGVVLVSVDPDRDTPPLLARYVSHFGPSFTGVTGKAETLGALTDQLGVALFKGAADADGNYAVDHSAGVFLVDPRARVTAHFNTPHDAAAMARDFRRIVAAS